MLNCNFVEEIFGQTGNFYSTFFKKVEKVTFAQVAKLARTMVYGTVFQYLLLYEDQPGFLNTE